MLKYTNKIYKTHKAHTISELLLKFRLLFFVFSGFFLVFASFFLGNNAFANTNNVQITFEECANAVCQRVSNENTTHALVANLQAGQKMKIGISVLNPQQQNLYSVESWLKFDPTKISVSQLSSENSDFPLEAPGEFEVDNQAGVIKIGRAIAGAPTKKPRNFVASFEITAKQNTQNSQLSFIDYRSSDVGKTSVLTIQNMVPQNVLTTKPKDLIFSSNISQNTNIHNAPSQYTNPSSAQYNQNGNNVYGVQNSNSGNSSSQSASQYQTDASQIPSFISIPRPKGLRTRTYKSGKIEHIWKMGSDPRISGYYLYYSTTSGKYMHRKDLGKTNISQFPAEFFEKGTRIYFAVQAYDRKGKISDFSDETYITVGTEGSESHPFFEQIFPNVQLDENKKAYRTIDGKQVSGTSVSGNSASQYSSNLSNKYPSQNTQSGGSENFLFLILGLALAGFGMVKMRRKL